MVIRRTHSLEIHGLVSAYGNTGIVHSITTIKMPHVNIRNCIHRNGFCIAMSHLHLFGEPTSQEPQGAWYVCLRHSSGRSCSLSWSRYRNSSLRSSTHISNAVNLCGATLVLCCKLQVFFKNILLVRFAQNYILLLLTRSRVILSLDLPMNTFYPNRAVVQSVLWLTC